MRRGSIVLAFAAALASVACSSSSGDAGPTNDGASDADDTATPNDSVIGADVDDSTADVSLDEETSGARTLDCTWAKDPRNCWRAFVKTVDGCLGNAAGSGEMGTTSADGKSCTYVTGRAVAFVIAFDAIDADVDRDFTVTTGGKTCLRYVEHAGTTGFQVTGPTGTLTYSAVANDVTVKCPDGTTYEGDAKKIALGCGEAILSGGVPGNQIEASPDRFKLMGSVDWDFDCASASSDAGVDGDAPAD